MSHVSPIDPMGLTAWLFFVSKKCQPKKFWLTARFRPPEAWRSPVLSTWEVWRPLCAKLGGNPAAFQRKTILRKTHSFRGNLPEIRVGKNMGRQHMPTNFAQKIGSTLVRTTPNQ